VTDFPDADRTATGTAAPKKLRVLAAMSGGVDSAVAAARAAEAGHDVTGVHLALSANPQSFRTGARGCCTVEDSRDARRAADVIGIPFYVWDLAERFREDVVDDFVAEYAAGRTPNPCLRCNEKIKFAALLDKALALGFDAVCTGHYATVLVKDDGTRELHRASDAAKDQSYVLGVLDERQLAHAMFPLGDTLTTKDEIRAEAERRGLAVARKPDSHDICFIADGDTQGFLAKHLGTAEGDIVDEDGERVGTHTGAYGFTIGQRKGLRIGVPADDGKPRYVLDISPVNNTVTVGPADALDVTSLTAIRPRWCGTPPAGRAAYTAQLRAHGEDVPVTAEPADGELLVDFAEPVRGIAPGQAVVLYDGTRVVGSATIATTRRTGAGRTGSGRTAADGTAADTSASGRAGAEARAGADTVAV
jgi:tRNA-specific 2-thiouridylase